MTAMLMTDDTLGRMDAVIAWVDGGDPAHETKRRAAMQKLGLDDPEQTNFASATRFSDLGEIYYCIASILKYAPFIRRIFVVTDAQKPAGLDAFAVQGLCAPDRIRVVDHREIFRDHLEALPTFNIRPIEALLWNIEGIGEYFLYFNDDFFLNAPLHFDDLVMADGTLRLEGSLRPVASKLAKHKVQSAIDRLLGRRHPPVRTNLAQALSARIAGQSRYLAVGHIPRPQRTATLRDFLTSRPALLRDQLRDPFRSSRQFAPYVLANQLELAAGRAVVEPEQRTVYLKPSNEADTENQLALIDEGRLRYGCIQSLDEFSPDRRAAVRATLARKFAGFLPPDLMLS